MPCTRPGSLPHRGALWVQKHRRAEEAAGTDPHLQQLLHHERAVDLQRRRLRRLWWLQQLRGRQRQRQRLRPLLLLCQGGCGARLLASLLLLLLLLLLECLRLEGGRLQVGLHTGQGGACLQHKPPPPPLLLLLLLLLLRGRGQGRRRRLAGWHCRPLGWCITQPCLLRLQPLMPAARPLRAWQQRGPLLRLRLRLRRPFQRPRPLLRRPQPLLHQSLLQQPLLRRPWPFLHQPPAHPTLLCTPHVNRTTLPRKLAGLLWPCHHLSICEQVLGWVQVQSPAGPPAAAPAPTKLAAAAAVAAAVAVSVLACRRAAITATTAAASMPHKLLRLTAVAVGACTIQAAASDATPLRKPQATLLTVAPAQANMQAGTCAKGAVLAAALVQATMQAGCASRGTGAGNHASRLC